ncbi:amidase (plasmid) [Streptomyces sp. CA-142005]|uniref:amidase n=1 Tax=Streptomyces sp. CA-142005 TaxID=3240052 RepID=UPI003D922CDA
MGHDAVWRVYGEPLVAGAGAGPLKGVRVAVKDLFAVAGQRVGAGNPTWLAEADEESAHAWAVRALLEAGADVVGIAHTDEFAYSLEGTNAHYGTPPNPAAPGRVPGGSSSGPASAVALGQADAGLGSDTAGSIRVPASYCGLYGMRPTHGAVPVTGMLPLAPAFDTVGWLARDARMLARMGEVLLPAAVPGLSAIRNAVVAKEPVRLVEDKVRQAFETSVQDIVAGGGLAIEERRLTTAHTGLHPVEGPAEWAAAFTTVQGAQAWECDGNWVDAHPGALGPAVTQRFAWAASVTADDRVAAERILSRAGLVLRGVIPPGTVLLLPATGAPAPLSNAAPELRAAIRQATVSLTCLASIAGLPCLAMPLMSLGGLPVGVCAIGAPGSDRALLELAQRIMPREESGS